MSAATLTTDSLRQWLFDRALPLWRCHGADTTWGYHESLTQTGEPTGAPRRLRVHARQAHAFGVAGMHGWNGPWRSAVEHGLRALERYARPDGLYRTLVTVDGETADDRAVLYDHAFVLLALAAAHRAFDGSPEPRATALRTLDRLEELSAHPEGGFRELNGDLHQHSNPHMHLLEAMLTWCEIEPFGRWSRLADGIAQLALRRLIDPRSGAVLEHFAADWSRLDGPIGRIVEPGHQYEWAWLLMRWSALKREPIPPAVWRMVRFAERYGWDPKRGVAVNMIAASGLVLDPAARLWPQTERLRLARAAMRTTGDVDYEKMAVVSERAIAAYLSTEMTGLWRDAMLADGSFDSGPAPASSLYHLVGAILEPSSCRPREAAAVDRCI